MGATDVSGDESRRSRFGAYFDELRKRKARIAAFYRKKRGDYAYARGNLDDAIDYYDGAVKLYGRLGNRNASMVVGERLANVARENGDLGQAREQFERLAQLNARQSNAVAALSAMEEILDVAERQNDDDAVEEWWGKALTALGRADSGEIDSDRHDRLVNGYADAVHTPDSATRLYGFALEKLVAVETSRGVALLEATWERRDVVPRRSDVYRLVLAAGVGLVAHAELTGRDVDRETILDTVEADRERLSERAVALFDLLRDGETDADPSAFRSDVDLDDPTDLRTLEGEAFGRLLQELR